MWFVHHERNGSPAFVFDLMEPERPTIGAPAVTTSDAERGAPPQR
jgi:hypothetical protein